MFEPLITLSTKAPKIDTYNGEYGDADLKNLKGNEGIAIASQTNA